jgi:hypothetical protein
MSKKMIHLFSFFFILSMALMCNIAKADLVGWWRFDESSGTTALDSSGNGNDGTIEGGAEWVDGQLGGALQFNGSDSHVRAPHIPFDNRSFTIMMWVNPVLYTSEQVVFSQTQSRSTNVSMHYRIYGPDSGRIRMGFYSNDLDTTTTIEQNNWYHITFWYDFENQNRRIYVNGVLEAEASATPYLGTSGDTIIGSWATDQWFRGIIDDVQIYDHPLTENEIQAAMLGLEGYPYSASPVPKDGTMHFDTWASLSWRAGDFAVSHDVYFCENFNDVNDGAESIFRGNQTDTFFVVGFPGFPYPEGLVPGTTYYWRIDEVNDAEPNSPWKGKVWNFMVPPKTAYNPIPADGAKFIAPDAQLTWSAGLGSKLHTVYFGDNFDDVNNATGGSPQGNVGYNPGQLEFEKTYYWRVDEFDAPITHKGEVWSFNVAKEGGGIKGEYFNNMDLSGTPTLVRIDSQINFYWNPGPDPPPGINEDGFSVRWTGELEAPFSELTTFITGSDDGVRMYLDGVLIIDDWNDHDRTENRSDPIELIEGHTYGVVVEGYENAGEAEWQLYWESPSMPRQLIPQAALSPPIKASSPKPANGAVDVRQTSILSWSPGDAAVSHDVYFGTDAEAVKNADTSSPEYKGSKQLDSESYDPGQLEWNITYYWRIDETEDGGVIQKGNLWSFTTADFLIVDDVELYNDLNPDDPASNRIFNAWLDGFVDPTNGSIVGYDTPPFAERTVVHGGLQSMPFAYDNSAAGKSEATLTLTDVRNWTQNGVDTLAIWYIGDPANAAEQMYVTLNGTARVNNSNPNAAQVNQWTEWRIPLSEFTGVNLSNVNSITLGLSSVTGGTGTMFFDDIRLHVTAP